MAEHEATLEAAARQSTADAACAPPASDGFREGLVLDGRYRIERLLGEGGMGSVWVARQLTLERDVAVKALRGLHPTQRARLRREALTLASVHHSAIVGVIDYGETEAGPYVVMELVRGESLAARLARSGPMPAREAVDLVLPLLDGLAVAHEAGVVHRDLKPDNIVLASRERDGAGAIEAVQPRLLDFGIALLTSQGDARLTRDGVVGTPSYMAPEQLRGLELDARVDVWGIGATLYEMIEGAPPFGADNVLAVMSRVLEQPPSYPRKARGLDGRLWAILTNALRKDPLDRLTSVLVLREALAAWRDANVPPRTREENAPISAPTSAHVSARARPSPTPHAVSATGEPAASSRREARAGESVPPTLDSLIRTRLGR
jgi:serine/threonine-protein kinase